MKKIVYPTLVAIASLFVCSAHATLIGDTVTISLQSPIGNSYFTTNTVVQAGAGDLTPLNGLPLVLNPEASSFNLHNISTVPSILFPNLGGFNGLVVTGINDTISSFSIKTDLVGWNDSRLTFTANSFFADFRDLEFGATNGLFDIEVCVWCLEINPPIKTPDSGSSAVLLAVGVLGLAAVSRGSIRGGHTEN